MSSQRTTLVTPEEYLEIERRAERKSEYFRGQMFATAGTSLVHVLIVANLGRELGNRLETGPCGVYSSDLRLRVSPNGFSPIPV
jgi:Uma2 family endonuclease